MTLDRMSIEHFHTVPLDHGQTAYFQWPLLKDNQRKRCTHGDKTGTGFCIGSFSPSDCRRDFVLGKTAWPVSCWTQLFWRTDSFTRVIFRKMSRLKSKSSTDVLRQEPQRLCQSVRTGRTGQRLLNPTADKRTEATRLR